MPFPFARVSWFIGLACIGSLGTARPAAAGAPTRFAWQILPARQIHPEGWLREEWRDDFKHGLPGLLDLINHDVAHAMFAKQNAEIHVGGRPNWWPGDSEGYWEEAYVHAAFQVGDDEEKARATRYVESILKSQGPDGYLGIYGKESRLLPVSDPRYGEGGGEITTQSHLFLTLIAFYEQTGRGDVLAAVERAAQVTMSAYSTGVFGTAGALTKKAGGNSHAVCFIDPMMQLYRLTGSEAYLRFVRTMYESYNRHPPRDHDLSRASLENPSALFVGHGAHTAESFHWLPAVALLGDPAARRLAAVESERLGRQLTAGGALISDEMIDGRLGNGHDLYEYCTQAELLKSLAWITQYTGSRLSAERAARLFFNAEEGARLHPLKAIEYLSRDDRMDIPTDERKYPSNIRNDGSHFQMSSIIRPACCPASSGRPYAYFLSTTWMKRPTGAPALAVMNFAPTSVAVEMGAVKVRIRENTDYPFSDDVSLMIHAEQPVDFDLFLRMPPEGDLRVVGGMGITARVRDGFLILRKTWSDDRIRLKLELPVVVEKTGDGQSEYYRRGSLSYGLPFKAEVRPVFQNPRWADGKPSGLFEYDIRVPDKSTWGYRLDPAAAFTAVHLDGDPLDPFRSPTLGLSGTMIDAQGQSVPVTLVPMGSTLSRRVTFLDRNHTAAQAAFVPTSRHVALGL